MLALICFLRLSIWCVHPLQPTTWKASASRSTFHFIPFVNCLLYINRLLKLNSSATWSILAHRCRAMNAWVRSVRSREARAPRVGSEPGVHPAHPPGSPAFPLACMGSYWSPGFVQLCFFWWEPDLCPPPTSFFFFCTVWWTYTYLPLQITGNITDRKVERDPVPFLLSWLQLKNLSLLFYYHSVSF